MKIIIITFITAVFLIAVGSANAMDSHKSHSSKGMKMDQGKDAKNHGENFKHDDMANGVHSEFQVMSLASMNMKDPEGKTHHIMVKLMDGKSKKEIKKAVGKIKVIGPDGKEQISALQNYNGLLAANFTFEKPGRYGVIFLFKNEGRKHLVKFWYPHKG